MREELRTQSAAETQKFANEFAQKLQGGDVVLLFGNLGAGKTTFVQGLGKALGIERRIISPTFIILRTYQVQPSTMLSQEVPLRNFYHVDLYRLGSEKEIEDIGLVSLMGDEENIVVIEWPERLGSLMPKNAWKLYFENEGEDKRKIRVEDDSREL